MNKKTDNFLIFLGWTLSLTGLVMILTQFNFTSMFDTNISNFESSSVVAFGALTMFVGTVLWLSVSQKLDYGFGGASRKQSSQNNLKRDAEC